MPSIADNMRDIYNHEKFKCNLSVLQTLRIFKAGIFKHSYQVKSGFGGTTLPPTGPP